MKRQYYIGLNGHSKNCFFVVLDGKGKIVCREKVATAESTILQFVNQFSGEVHLIMDETTITQWLYVLLHDEVTRIVVAQSEKHRKAKTDFKEAEEHARNLLANYVKQKVYHECTDIMELRSLVSGYRDLVQNLVAEKNRYNALFRQSAIVRSGDAFYQDFELINSLRTDIQKFVAIPLYERIQQLEKHQAMYEKQFKANCKKYKTIRLLTSIPGIGTICANQIVALVVTPYRFPTKYNFYSYCMLIRHKQNSDGVVYGTKRPMGQTELNTIFKSSRLAVVKGTSALRLKYDLMQENGTTQKAAFNALSRSIAAMVLGVWKSGEKYDDKKVERSLKRTYSHILT
jgi:transposase